MTAPIVLCTDGSAETSAALSAGLDLLGRDHDVVLVTVMDGPDEGSLVGSGHAGPELSLEEYDERVTQAAGAAQSVIDRAQIDLALGMWRFTYFEVTPVMQSVGWPPNCQPGPLWLGREAEVD